MSWISGTMNLMMSRSEPEEEKITSEYIVLMPKKLSLFRHVFFSFGYGFSSEEIRMQPSYIMVYTYIITFCSVKSLL